MNICAVVVYALIDPRTDEVRYIGKAINPASRLRVHVCDAKRGKQFYSSRWIRTLLRENLRPVLRILCTFGSEDEALTAEVGLIASCRRMNYRLTNLTDGGEGVSGLKWRPESVELLREKAKQRGIPTDQQRKMQEGSRLWRLTHSMPPCSEQKRAKLRAARARQVIDPEAYRRAGLARRGFHHPPEVIEKMSAAKRGKKFSESHKRKMSEVRKGKPLPESTRRKAWEWRTSNPMSEAHKLAISTAKKGRKFSEEHRAALRAAWARRRKPQGATAP